MNQVKVIRKGGRRSRILLSDGTQVVVPNESVNIGGAFEYRSEKENPKIDVEREMNYIRTGIKAFMRTGWKLPPSWTFEDLTSELFIHFWERNLWADYDSTKANPYYFVASAVANFLKTFSNSTKTAGTYKTSSLNRRVGKSDDSQTQVQDLLPSSSTVENDVLTNIVLEQVISDLDQNYTTGLKLTYRDLFRQLSEERKDINEIALEAGYSVSTVNKRKSWLRKAIERALCGDEYLDLVPSFGV